MTPAETRQRQADAGGVLKKYLEYVTTSRRLSARREDMAKGRKMGWQPKK